jgi:hypothetical protein
MGAWRPLGERSVDRARIKMTRLRTEATEDGFLSSVLARGFSQPREEAE